jgi:Protein of unknown function (DUF3617)
MASPKAARPVQTLARVLALWALSGATLAGGGIEPGNWEFTVDVSLAQAGGSTGPLVSTRCLTEADARDPQRVLAETESSGCEFSDTRDTGEEYTFAVDCRGGAVPVHGTGRVRYTAQTLQGVIDLVAEQPNLRITTHSRLSARRLGPCKS